MDCVLGCGSCGGVLGKFHLFGLSDSTFTPICSLISSSNCPGASHICYPKPGSHTISGGCHSNDKSIFFSSSWG